MQASSPSVHQYHAININLNHCEGPNVALFSFSLLNIPELGTLALVVVPVSFVY